MCLNTSSWCLGYTIMACIYLFSSFIVNVFSLIPHIVFKCVDDSNTFFYSPSRFCLIFSFASFVGISSKSSAELICWGNLLWSISKSWHVFHDNSVFVWLLKMTISHSFLHYSTLFQLSSFHLLLFLTHLQRLMTYLQIE